MSIINKLKAVADIITPPTGYKTLFFRSDTGVPAVKDENGTVSDLVIPGDASGVTYTPADSLDWSDSTDPGNVDDALDDLAARTRELENDSAVPEDAAEVTYTPAVVADWDGDVDPGDVKEGLDQLAARVTDIEEAPTVSDAADVTYTPAHAIHWTDSEDPGNVDDALDDLAARVQSLEETGGGAADAADLTYTPAVLADWDGAADPGNGKQAFDQLAERTKDLEEGSAATFTTSINVACSDETTALTTGTAKVTFRAPTAMTLTSVASSVTTAPTGATLVVDINVNGSTILSTKLSIDISEETSTTAATPAVISSASIAAGDEITIDIDQVGSTIAGAGLKVYLIGTVAGSIAAGSLTLDASQVTFTPAHSIHWTDSEDPGDVDDALNDLGSRVQALEEGGGGGDSTTTAAYASRPAAGNSGNLFFPTDGLSIQRDNGSIWVPYGPIFKLTEPDDTQFTWVNQGTATYTKAKGTILLSKSAEAGNNLRMLVKSAPATPYTITTLFSPGVLTANFSTCGLVFRASGAGTIAVNCIVWSSGFLFSSAKYNSATSFNSNYVTISPMHSNFIWLRIRDDGTNRYCDYSRDGLNWINYHSVGRTDFLTADQVGFFVDSNGGGNVFMNLLSWEQT